MQRWCCQLSFLLLFGIVLLGCEPPSQTASKPTGPPLPSPPPGASSLPPPTTEPADSPVPSAAPLPPETKFGAFAGGIDELAARPSGPPPKSTPQPTEEAAAERVKAEKGVGIKGRSLDQYSGIMVEPAKAYFAAKERIVFDVQIPHALNLFKASEGRGPSSHEEFMEKIVGFNQIKLPQLRQGDKYVYDVAQEQLMVERPAQR